jgi:hypothetical protein
MLRHLTAIALLALMLWATGCINSEKAKAVDGFEDFDQCPDQVEVCIVLGIQSDEFMAFMREKGIPTNSPGGDEFHSITVNKKRVSEFLEIAQTDEIVDHFEITITHKSESGEIQSW